MMNDQDHRGTGLDRRTLLKAGGAVAGGVVLSAFGAHSATAAAAGGPRPPTAGALPQIDRTVAATVGGAPFLESVLLWEPAGPVVSNRIPGFLALVSGVTLAASEARLGDEDSAPHHIVVRRSTTQGATWLSEVIVEPSITDESWCNPTFVQDRESERVFLFYTLNHGGITGDLYYRYSDDDGVTWSTRTDITALYAGNTYGWTNHSPGPGNGLQLVDGRLLMQVWHRRSVLLPFEQRLYGLSVIYSDDGGLTWALGGIVAVDPDYPVGETRIIERADGVLVYEGRYIDSAAHSRIVTASSDRGASWAPLELMAGIPARRSADIGFTRMTAGGLPRVLCSWLDDATRLHNLTLSLSYDEGVTFPVSKLVNPGHSGYSSIQTHTDGLILVIYETARKIMLARLNLEWLTDGTDSIATGPGIERIVWQAEDQTITSNRPGAITIVADPFSIGGERVEFAAAAAGDYVQFPITVATAGTYALAARCVKRSDRGQFQMSVDGASVGTVKDARSAARSHPLYPAGSVALTAGAHTVRLTVPGTSGADRYLGLDYVQLIKQ